MGMNKIPMPSAGEVFTATNKGTQKVKSAITAKFSSIVSIAVTGVVYLMFFTKGKIASAAEIKELSLIVVALLFANNVVFNNMIESGQKTARKSIELITCIKDYENIFNKAKNTTAGVERLSEYCEEYNKTSLENDRKELLNSEGVEYAAYRANYISRTKRDLKKLKTESGKTKLLTKAQIKAICKANKLKSISLKPNQILRAGHAASRRRALGIAPEQKIKFVRIRKLFTSAVVSGLSAAIVLDMLTDFSFAKFVEATVKIAPILTSAYMGFKTGYNNIYLDTVAYIDEQTTYLTNYIKWLETAPPKQSAINML